MDGERELRRSQIPKRAANGFAWLSFDGARLDEQLVNAAGVVKWSSSGA